MQRARIPDTSGFKVDFAVNLRVGETFAKARAYCEFLHIDCFVVSDNVQLQAFVELFSSRFF